MPHAAYDSDAEVLYVQLLDDETSANQKFLDDLRILDYSADGAVVGVEFIAASAGIDLTDVPFAARVEELIGQGGHSFKIFA